MPSRPSRRRQSRAFASGLLLIALLLVGGVALAVAMPGLDLAGRRIPAVALDAYRSAAAKAPRIRASCTVDWRILAAIGKVESDHGRSGTGRTLHADGTVTPAIIGPTLNGQAGTEAIPDTDKGRLDGDARWDHAVGPLQFIPSTFRELGRDGNGDGKRDPNNLYDAALTAVAHLCLREPGNYANRDALRRSLIAYNASRQYADEVLAWIDTYRAMPDSEIAAPSGT